MAVMIWMCSASRILLPQCYFVVVSEMSIFRIHYIVKEKDIVDQNIEGMRSLALHLLFGNADMKNPLLASGRSTTFLNGMVQQSMTGSYIGDNNKGNKATIRLLGELALDSQLTLHCVDLTSSSCSWSANRVNKEATLYPTPSNGMWLGFQPPKLSRAAFHVCMIASGAYVIVQTKAAPLDDPPNLQGKGMVQKRPSLGCSQKQGIKMNLYYYQLGITFPPFGFALTAPACDPKSGFVNVVVSWGIPFPCSILSLARRVCGCQSIHLQHGQSISDGR
uniref:Uncharacterized protein n=1 Tax=Musa balbisiana TaxID=52838 RepID=Q1EP71_MUSBA|nr:hypothetical protein MBP_81C12.10 [Musa balbisiana]